MSESSESQKKQPIYNRKDELMKELFDLKTKQFYTKQMLKQHLIDKYGYTETTAQTYYEDVNQLVLKNYEENFEQNLADSIEYMQEQVRNEPNSFIRLQWLKELNKVKGLHISKSEIKQTITNIQTIKLVANNPVQQALYEDLTPKIEPVKEENEFDFLINPIKDSTDKSSSNEKE